MTTTNSKKMPRGLRNNNPLNIRKGKISWVGQVTPGTDAAFCQFKHMVYGWRAAFILLKQYYDKHQCRTIRAIISRWAPPSDGNYTEEYIRRVCAFSGLDHDDQLPAPAADHRLWIRIARAMSVVENGDASVCDYYEERGNLYLCFMYDCVVGFLLAQGEKLTGWDG